MGDRELLEAAAKAVGIELEWDARGAYERIEGVSGNSQTWSPLTDDGDALRLAVKLRINIQFSGEQRYNVSKRQVFDVCCEPEGEDYIRRAIVRAAAEIGKDKS